MDGYLPLRYKKSAYTLYCRQSSVIDSSESTCGRIAIGAPWTQVYGLLVPLSTLRRRTVIVVGPLRRVCTLLAENIDVSSPCARALLLTADVRRPALVTVSARG